MPKLSQKGFAVNLLVIALLVLGIGMGTFLAQKQTQLDSNASESGWSGIVQRRSLPPISQPSQNPAPSSISTSSAQICNLKCPTYSVCKFFSKCLPHKGYCTLVPYCADRPD